MTKILFFLIIFVGFSAKANNLHLIDEEESGFAIYRTSAPSYKDMKKFCKLGIEEMVVLSGNAGKFEVKHQKACPSLKVVFNKKQKAKRVLTTSFLEWFDGWVEDARRTGKKIAFRCNCGCHRTGRLAAYYQMKYQGLTSSDAQVVMKKRGRFMAFYKYLNNQVVALEDYIDGKECSQKRKYCVKED